MGLTALDLGVRGAVSGLFLMIVLVLLRLRPSNTKIRLGAAMSAVGTAYAIATAPFVPKPWLIMVLPILAANPALFWLWARVTFDDDFVLKRWHRALWFVMVGFAYFVVLGWTTWPTLTFAGAKCLSGAALVLAVAAVVQTVETWREDLVAGRRRLRIAVLAFNVILIAVMAGSDLASVPIVSLGALGSLGSALGLLAIATLVGWSLFGATATPAILATADLAAGNRTRTAEVGRPSGDARDTVAPTLLRRLDHLMTAERAYRQEGLTIGLLAAKLGLPEYRLRQAINEGLGYRNFNAFLNRYRIDDAKTALSDASQREVPVLTIAMDAGFQSIGPFNRAFKTETGMTPTEFRRDALARSQGSASTSEPEPIAKSADPVEEFGWPNSGSGQNAPPTSGRFSRNNLAAAVSDGTCGSRDQMDKAHAAAPAPERLHALDAVRGYALLLGIVLHATLSFIPGQRFWFIQDTRPSLTLAVLFFVIHVFRMTTFFLIAGFFAHMSFHRRGALGFVTDRLRRIALPLLAGWPIVFMAIVIVALGGHFPHGGVARRSATGPRCCRDFRSPISGFSTCCSNSTPQRCCYARPWMVRSGRPLARWDRPPGRPAATQSVGARNPGRAGRPLSQPRPDLVRLDGGANAGFLARYQPAGARRLRNRVRLRLAAASPA